MPAEPQMFRCHVVRTERLSPSFQRITIAGDSLKEFTWAGVDHWFRLFFPLVEGQDLVLPEFEGRQWWQPYLDIPEDVRPHCSNYTVADFRDTETGPELDIDVVLHWDESGEVAGRVARWSVYALPGSPVGFLDQGLLFDPTPDVPQIVVATDETGVPGVRGILASLSESVTGHVIIEVGTAGDVESLAHPQGVEVTWHVREQATGFESAYLIPGGLALKHVQQLTDLNPDAYAYVVGESTLATEGRRALVRAGLNKKKIFFSGFWKYTPHEVLASA